MIYMFVALYQEAKTLIHALQLKKQRPAIGFDVYENDEMRLVLTGTGALAAATAVGSALSFYRAGGEDLLVNWGSCAGELSEGQEEKCGAIYRCNKLVDLVSRNTYYPDMLVRSELPEACVVMESEMWEGKKTDKSVQEESVSEKNVTSDDGVILHDMEAAAIYYAGAHFFSPHQMHFVKTVTDFGVGSFSPEVFSDVMERTTPGVLSYLEQLKNWQRGEREMMLNRWEKTEEMEKIFAEFRCSETMKAAFMQCMRYWTLAGTDYRMELENMRASGELPCRDRREGKKKFEQLREKLL